MHVPKRCSRLHATHLIGRKLKELRFLSQAEDLDRQMASAMERDV